jgi:curved DNA-binding protein
MAFIDYYKTLGINKTASTEDIKKAYRKMARKYHPDINPNDKEAQKKFQQINEANEVLGDPDKRKKYDAHGENWKHADQYEQARQSQRQQGRPNDGYTYSDFGDNDDFSDFFSSMFGNQGGRGRSTRNAKYRGQDYTATITITLEDAFKTHQQTINVNDKKLRITIPAGIADGQVIKLGGQGGPGVNGGPNGDLLITFIISPHHTYKRQGNDIHMNVDLNLYTAILGGDLTIDTLDGKVKLKVKPETQNNTKVRLKGKGFPVYKKDGEAGDLFITYSIQIPTGLNEEQKALFEKLSKT